MVTVPAPLLLLSDALVRAADRAPEPEDVKAGYVGLAVFVGLIVVVALLAWSLIRRLRKVRQADQAGVYGSPERRPADQPAETSTPD